MSKGLNLLVLQHELHHESRPMGPLKNRFDPHIWIGQYNGFRLIPLRAFYNIFTPGKLTDCFEYLYKCLVSYNYSSRKQTLRLIDTLNIELLTFLPYSTLSTLTKHESGVSYLINNPRMS